MMRKYKKASFAQSMVTRFAHGRPNFAIIANLQKWD